MRTIGERRRAPGRLDRRDGLGHALPGRRPRPAHHPRARRRHPLGHARDLATGRARRRRHGRGRRSRRADQPRRRRARRPSATRSAPSPPRPKRSSPPPWAATGSCAVSVAPIPPTEDLAPFPARPPEVPVVSAARSTSTASTSRPTTSSTANASDHATTFEDRSPSTGVEARRRRARRRTRGRPRRSTAALDALRRVGGARPSERGGVPRPPGRPDRPRRRDDRPRGVPGHGHARREPATARHRPRRAQLSRLRRPRRGLRATPAGPRTAPHNTVLRMPAGPDRRHHARGTPRSCSRRGSARRRSPRATPSS